MNDSNVLFIIDNDKLRLDKLKKLFCNDFTVIDSPLGDEAIQFLLSNNTIVSSVLLDCTEKDGAGFEILDTIQKAPILSGIPVIVFLGHQDTDGCIRALDKGAVDAIGVPFVEPILHRRVLNTVNNYLSRSSTRMLLLREQEIISEMNGALSAQQFVIYLQPVYSLSVKEAVSAEALTRWIHPEKGLISPGAFIPLFEQTGFITKLDRYVWETVCKYIRFMLDSKKQVLPISVNISRVSLREDTVCSDIVRLTQKYSVPTNLIRFEITESAYTDNPTLLLKTLADLHEAGFSIMMDDFGSGYSSLNMLKDMPVDVLKIDMCFLGGFETSARAGNILTSVVRMAKWLNIPVIAEGVETKTQVDFLRSIGCDRIQGYYFSKPLPVDEYEKKISLLDKRVSGESFPIIFEESNFDTLFNGNQLTSRLFNSVIGAIGIYEFTEDNLEVIRVNDGYYDIFGYNPQTFYEDTSFTLGKVVEDDRQILLDACRSVINGEQIEELTVRRYKTDGTVLYIGVRIRFLGGSDDHPIVCLAMNDITSKKEDEQKILLQQEALKKHNEFLQSQYDSVPCGIVRFSVEDEAQLRSFNAACLRIYGFTKREQFEAICKKSIVNIIHQDDHIYFQNMLNKRFYSDSAIYFESRILKADESIGYISGALDLIETPEGETEFQIVFMDVTEEKEFESQKMLSKYSKALFTQFDQIFEFNFTKRTVTKIITNGELAVMTENTMYMDRVLSGWFTRYIDSSYKEIAEQFYKNIENRAQSDNHALDTVSSLEYKRLHGKGTVWNRITVIPLSDSIYLVCNVDISASKNAEILKEQNIKLQMKQKENEVMDTLMQNVPVGFGIFKIGKSIKTMYISSKACEIFGYSHDEYIAMVEQKGTVLTNLPSEDNEQYMRKLIENKTLTSEFILKAQKNNGDEIWIRVLSRSVMISDDEAINYAVLSDITEQRSEELKNEQQNTLYKMLLEDSQPVIFDYNFETDAMNYSVLLPEKKRESRSIPNYFSTLTTTGIVKKESREAFKTAFMTAFENPGFGSQDFEANFFGDEFRWYRAKFKSIADSTGKVCRLVGRATDVTDQIRYANRLKDKAETDEMTGLYNHSSAIKQIDAALKLNTSLSVFFMFDIDNFKDINDKYGHPTGDAVLQRVATILKDEFRSDDIKARLGGDEFAVFCQPNCENELIERKATDILKKVKKISYLEGLSIDVSISIGVAFAPDAGNDFKTIFAAADKALYSAKNNGKNQVAFYKD